MVEQITQSYFKDVLSKNKKVVVDYFAEWCGPCQMMHPVVQELAKKYTDIKFVKVDIDQNTNLAISQQIEVVPTFIAYKNGEEVNRIIGYNSKQDFELFLQTI